MLSCGETLDAIVFLCSFYCLFVYNEKFSLKFNISHEVENSNIMEYKINT